MAKKATVVDTETIIGEEAVVGEEAEGWLAPVETAESLLAGLEEYISETTRLEMAMGAATIAKYIEE